MGYTHYWTPRAFTAEEWTIVCRDVRKIIKACPVPLALEYDEPGKKPEVSKEAIRFNGPNEAGHETFMIGRTDTGFQFCKTNGKPYDAAVTAILAYLAQTWDFKVTSDGDKSDWEAGTLLASAALRTPVPVPAGVT